MSRRPFHFLILTKSTDVGQQPDTGLSKSQCTHSSLPRVGKITTERRIKTKWRHALRHPKLATYRKEVEALDESHIKFARQDRLRKMDEINERGSIEQKRVFLKQVLVKRKKGILPVFYSKKKERYQMPW